MSALQTCIKESDSDDGSVLESQTGNTSITATKYGALEDQYDRQPSRTLTLGPFRPVN